MSVTKKKSRILLCLKSKFRNFLLDVESKAKPMFCHKSSRCHGGDLPQQPNPFLRCVRLKVLLPLGQGILTSIL